MKSEILFLAPVSFRKNEQIMRNLDVLWMGDVGNNVAHRR